MLDRKFIVENADLIRTNCVNRGVKCDLDRLLELEASRRQVLAQVEQLNRQLPTSPPHPAAGFSAGSSAPPSKGPHSPNPPFFNLPFSSWH